MAFPQSNARELQNRKILEEIQLKKQMLLKQGVTSSLTTPINATSTSSTPIVPATATIGTTPSAIAAATIDGNTVTASQRAALHNAHAASVGYFVTQDSSFGNLILPVLPRFDTK